MVARFKRWLTRYVYVLRDPAWYEHGDVIRLHVGVDARRTGAM